MSTRYLLVLAFIVLVTAGRAAPGSLAGRVTAQENREPLAGVNVFLQGTVRGTTTNLKGEFSLPDLRAGRYALILSMVGYQRLTFSDVHVDEGKETFLDVRMTGAPLQTEQVVVTANKREQSLQDVPLSISVLDATEIRSRNSLTIDEGLRYVPGVNMTGTQINIRGSSGYSLGAGSRVLMLLDGIPFIAGDTGELIFESIPAEQVDRIEVVKGASSALYGSNALGGVINVITKPIGERPVTTLRMYGGFYSNPAFEQWQWSTKTRSLNGQSVSASRTFGNVGASLFLARQFDDGYRRNDYRRRYNFLAKVHQTFSSASALTLNLGVLHQYSGQFLYWRSLDSALIPPEKHETDNLKSTRLYLNGLYNIVLADNIVLNAKAMWYHNTWGFQQMGDADRTSSLTDGIRTEVASTFVFDGLHILTAGLNGNVDMIRGRMFAQQTIGGLALFAQDEIHVSKEFTLTLGTRADFQSVGLTAENFQINPKIAAAHKLWPGTTLRASFGRGFRVPSIPEAFIAAGGGLVKGVPNSGLKPEISYSFETGVAQNIGEWGMLDLAVFRSDFNNLIEPGLIVAEQNLLVQWRNVIRARVQGFETSLKFASLDGDLVCSFGYTYVYPEDRIEHTILKYRPRHLLYTNARARIAFLDVDADFRYVSRVERIDDELVDAGIVPDGDERQEIYVVDARIGTEFSIADVPLTATFNIKNALQHNYVELIGNIMPPRSYVLTIEVRM